MLNTSKLFSRDLSSLSPCSPPKLAKGQMMDIFATIVPFASSSESACLAVEMEEPSSCFSFPSAYFQTRVVDPSTADNHALLSSLIQNWWGLYTEGQQGWTLSLCQVLSSSSKCTAPVFSAVCDNQTTLDELIALKKRQKKDLRLVEEGKLWELAINDTSNNNRNQQQKEGMVEFDVFSSRLIREFSPLRNNLLIRRGETTAIDSYLSFGELWKLEDYSLLDPCKYLFASPSGKQIRGKMALNLSNFFSIRQQDLDSLLWCIEQFHGLSLLIDDIEDNSLVRRERKCAHLVFGVALTLNSAYHATFRLIEAVPLMFTTKQVEIQQLLLQKLVQIHRGQGKDIAWRDRNYCPSEAEYIEMIREKTSAPFVLLCQIFFLLSDDWRLLGEKWASWSLSWVGLGFQRVGDKLEALFDEVGIFFQIRDDYINLTDPKYWEKKGFCDDIHERKYSFPIIRVIETKQGRYSYLLDLFRSVSIASAPHQSSSSDAPQELTRPQIEEALQVIKETDALEYTRNRCLQLKKNILDKMDNLGFSSLALPIRNLEIK